MISQGILTDARRILFFNSSNAARLHKLGLFTPKERSCASNEHYTFRLINPRVKSVTIEGSNHEVLNK